MRRLLFGLVLVAVLLAGADRIALLLAERGVAESVQRSEKLAEPPEVSIAGFPLLTQAVQGRYQQVDVTMKNLRAEDDVTLARLTIRLRGVDLPLADLTSGQVASVRADRATATGMVSYPALNAVARSRTTIPGLSFTFGDGSHGRMAVRGSYRGLVKVNLDGEAAVAVRGRSLVVTPVSSSLDELPWLVRAPLLGLLGSRYELPPLPFGFTPTSVGVGKNGVTVKAAASKVTLQ